MLGDTRETHLLQRSARATLRPWEALFLGRAGVSGRLVGEDLAALREEDAGWLIGLVRDAVHVACLSETQEKDVSTDSPFSAPHRILDSDRKCRMSAVPRTSGNQR